MPTAIKHARTNMLPRTTVWITHTGTDMCLAPCSGAGRDLPPGWAVEQRCKSYPQGVNRFSTGSRFYRWSLARRLPDLNQLGWVIGAGDRGFGRRVRHDRTTDFRARPATLGHSRSNHWVAEPRLVGSHDPGLDGADWVAPG